VEEEICSLRHNSLPFLGFPVASRFIAILCSKENSMSIEDSHSDLHPMTADLPSQPGTSHNGEPAPQSSAGESKPRVGSNLE